MRSARQQDGEYEQESLHILQDKSIQTGMAQAQMHHGIRIDQHLRQREPQQGTPRPLKSDVNHVGSDQHRIPEVRRLCRFEPSAQLRKIAGANPQVDIPVHSFYGRDESSGGRGCSTFVVSSPDLYPQTVDPGQHRVSVVVETSAASQRSTLSIQGFGEVNDGDIHEMLRN